MKQYTILVGEVESIMRNKNYPDIFSDIEKKDKGVEFRIDSSSNLDVAENLLSKSIDEGCPYTIAILDMKLMKEKPDREQNLAKLIRVQSPSTKIIFHTSIKENYDIHLAFKHIRPEGYLIKTEAEYEDLKKAILYIMDNQTYYTQSVHDFLKTRDLLSFPIDDLDLEILYRLSKKTKTSELPKLLSLSISGIETRKRRLATLFGLSMTSTASLVNFAKENNII